MEVYVNIQSDDPIIFTPTMQYIEKLEQQGLTVNVDIWNVVSTWFTPPKFNQDQSRLLPICMARNMCIERALAANADALLMIDSDVVVPPNSITRMLVVYS